MRPSNVPSARLRYLAGPLLLGGLALAGCGGDEDDSVASSAPTATATATATAAMPTPGGTATMSEFNDADVEFARGMIAHHRQAIEMAEIAADPARQVRPEVADLAARIKAAQDPEIVTMTGWLTTWGQPVEPTMSDGDNSSMSMTSREDMDRMATMTGAEFDDMWLTMMVEHHRGAIETAQQVQADGVNADARNLAAQIVTTQQAEIDEMSSLLSS